MYTTLVLAALGPLAPPDLPEPPGFEADLAAFAQAVRTEWSYFDDRSQGGFDLDAAIARERERLGPAPTRGELLRALERLTASLCDGHAHLEHPELVAPQRSLPLTLVETTEGVCIERVLADDLPREVSSELLGARLLALDGRAVGDLLAEIEERTAASTASGRRARALRALPKVDAETVLVRVRLSSGEERTISLASRPAAEIPNDRPPPYDLSFPRPHVARLAITRFSVPDWQGWLAASPNDRDAFLDAPKQELNALFERIRAEGSRVLILDVRGNVGGTDLLGAHVAGLLLAEPFVYMRLSGKYGGEWTPPFGQLHEPAPPERRFEGALLVLVDGHCFSTTDNFLRCLSDLHPDVTVLGQPTGGGTGAPRVLVTLPHTQAKLTACSMRVRGPKGELIEGRGTVPHLSVLPTPEDVANGRDAVLEKALALAAVVLEG